MAVYEAVPFDFCSVKYFRHDTVELIFDVFFQPSCLNQGGVQFSASLESLNLEVTRRTGDIGVDQWMDSDVLYNAATTVYSHASCSSIIVFKPRICAPIEKLGSVSIRIVYTECRFQSSLRTSVSSLHGRYFLVFTVN